MKIEEMYKVYGVKPLKQYTSCAWNSAENCPYSKDGNCIENCTQLFIVYEEYPPFTAEKQLELIKLITSTQGEFSIEKNNYPDGEQFCCFWSSYDSYSLINTTNKDFSQALAKLVIALKDKLDHTKVKEILEG